MSTSREVSSLPLAQNTIVALLENGFKYVADLQISQPLDLSQELSIPVEDALSIILTAQSSTKINVSQTAKDLILQTDSSNRSIITFSRAVDTMLGGGVPLGQVTEICGMPGCGKTQIGIQLSLDVQIPSSLSGLNGEAIYI
eukprot:gene13143-27795_t